MNPPNSVITFSPDAQLPIAVIALLLAAAAALILGIKDWVMNLKAGAPRDAANSPAAAAPRSTSLPRS